MNSQSKKKREEKPVAAVLKWDPHIFQNRLERTQNKVFAHEKNVLVNENEIEKKLQQVAQLKH